MRVLSTSLTLAGFAVLAGLAACSSSSDTNSTSGGASGVAGKPATGAAGSGNNAAGSPGAAGGAVVGTAGSGSGGTGVVGAAGNNNATGGTGSSAAGSNSSAGTGTVAGSNSGGGATGASGAGSTAGSANANAPDMMGKTNAKPGDKTSTKLDYLKLGEIRLINNNWGSVAWNCTDKSPASVYVNADKSFGWSFDRPKCAQDSTKPDFPELEFGIHPFGLGSSEATSPNFSSTTLLPKQIKDITSMSVKLESLKIELQSQGSWDLTFEFWLSKQNPATTQGNAGVYAELMTFWGWQANRWPIDGTSSSGPICDHGCGSPVAAGDGGPYSLIVQKDNWGSGWKYYQFRTGASSQSFNGTIDVKKLIDYMVSTGGATQDMWVTRLEVGSEIDDNTKGSVSMKNVTFEVNKETRSPVFGQ